MYKIEDKTLILDSKDRNTHTVNYDQFDYVMINKSLPLMNYIRFYDVSMTNYVPNKIVVRNLRRYLFSKSGEIYSHAHDARENFDVFTLKQGVKYSKSIFNSIKLNNMSLICIYSNETINQLQGVINYSYLNDLLKHNYVNKVEFSKYFNRSNSNSIDYRIDSSRDEEFIVFNNKSRYIIVNRPSQRFMLKKSGIIKLI